jgi:hypothetical protein
VNKYLPEVREEKVKLNNQLLQLLSLARDADEVLIALNE